jgi:hypothetical protein
MNLVCLAYHKLLSTAATKKVRSPSTNVYHLSPKAGEVPKDLPQQLRHAIADTWH